MRVFQAIFDPFYPVFEQKSVKIKGLKSFSDHRMVRGGGVK